MRKLPLVYLLAALLNWLWENLHAPLYIDYQGGAITQWILFRSAFFVDAIIITAMAILFLQIPYFRARLWWAFVIGLVPAIVMEKFALAIGRWAYGPHMPIVPLLHTGLTPTIQLGIIAYFVYKLVGLDRRVGRGL